MKTIRKPNNYTVYKQYDARWGSLPYPVLPSTLAGCGCGCCAVTHCAIELDRYINYTPKNVQPYMKQFAERGHGTLWKGITEGLKHYGLKNVREIGTMTELWKELEKGDRVGVLLFNKNTAPDGTLWTTGGHYVAFVGYKKSNDGKKHYLYTKDSGGRMHDGWYCYETSMKGCVRAIWTAEVPKQSIVLPERGYFDKGDRSDSIKKIQKFLKDKGFYNGKAGGRYGGLTKKSVKKFQKAYGLEADGLWGKKCTALYEKLI